MKSCLIAILATIHVISTASQTLQPLLASDDPFVSAEAVEPELIGADRPEFTQVAAAQNILRLSGAGVRACIFDSAVDYRNEAFGNCTAPGQPSPPECRIYFGYNGIDNTTDTRPTNSEQLHGTHVASICGGNFQTTRLVDAEGVPLPFQRGVAYRALVGAIKAGDTFPGYAVQRCFNAAVGNKCDVINMSWGSTVINPDKGFPKRFANLTAGGIITAAAAGNDGRAYGGDVLFITGSPSNVATFSVAALNNTANPGATLQLSRAIKTLTGQRKTLAVVLRSDTRGSICMPSCKDVPLPAALVLLKSRPAVDECFPPVAVTQAAHLQGKAVVLQVSAECADSVWNAADLWQPLVDMKPAIVLMAMSSKRKVPSNSGVPQTEVPTMWLDPDDGAALSAALEAEASDSSSSSPLKLQGIPGATLVPISDEYAMQPTEYSSWGPGVDLHLEPAISAPGNLYAALPGDSFQLWQGTSMATPYFSGVVALWLQHIRKTPERLPTGEALVAAARAALLNTARPIPYEDTQLMWPPAKVGAGLVQAYNAMINTVAITPPQLLLRTDTGRGQQLALTLTNTGTEHITYTIAHKPAVGVSFPRSWYAQAIDRQAPPAQVTPHVKSITVLAGGKATLVVTFQLPNALRELDNLVSGYITFTPVDPQQAADAETSSRKQRSVLPRLVPLAVPYQGATKDYSSIGEPNSLVLFAQPMPELNLVAAARLQGKPRVYVCSGVMIDDPVASCEYKPGQVQIVNADNNDGGMIIFATALVRPVANVSVQVFSGDGSKLLGHMKAFGGCFSSLPFAVAQLNYDYCETSYSLENFKTKYLPLGRRKYVRFLVDEVYSFRLKIWPIISAADRMAGVNHAGKPFVVPVSNTVKIVKRS